MKTFARIASVLILATGLTGATFAASTPVDYTYVSSVRTVADESTIGSVEVGVTPAIRSWFTANGVDGSLIDAPLGTLSADVKDDIDELVTDADLIDSLNALVNPVLKKALVRGEVEKATLRIGRHVWTVSLFGAED